ncbi:putative undecaprenyl-phosphate N-acetylglucosaminyl 1-phosphate transferase [Geomonas silvestris]|uniref:Putative undecaprenyl-phosphate N-acetylglucosaminyl 1-phosphate transferase n=1 Tax=Geomonas silvestris TaxID=2740184 RepID=A0A6V8MI44_9BACT|nr:MraY family glycosyltransferase [Geomonas silvestris]GFO59681.1 putative undecaprenyl-phosphate N-acetylglucosaminyl 1-phosphate transferase [Geomonas silvestris]
MTLFAPCLASFMLTAVLTPIVIYLATLFGCVDSPGERRLHSKVTPRGGGLAFFAGVLPMVLQQNGGRTLAWYLVGSALLVGLGMVDDLRPLGWKSKFSVMFLAATVVIFGGQVCVLRLGLYGALGQVELGWFAIPFTYLSIIGIVNAINLLDGLNGLAGGVSLLAFLFMGLAALASGNLPLAAVCFSFVGALGAFLLYNFPHAKIFMGDTGSLFLGFSLAVTAIMLTQGPRARVDPLFPVLLLLTPIFDTVRVLSVRLSQGKNPFKADNLHLHYLMVLNRISPVRATLLFWMVTTLLGAVALYLTSKSSTAYLMVVLYASSVLGLFAWSLSQGAGEPAASHPRTPAAGLLEADAAALSDMKLAGSPLGAEERM